MIVVKDSMVLIHLGKLSLLEKSCNYFGNIIIPKLVYDEVSKGKDKFPDAIIIIELVNKKKIIVENIKDKSLVKKANNFNIQRGEAESLALYWEKKADFLATDDDNVRKKKVILDLRIIGTPAIIIRLYREKIIETKKFEEAISELKKIGWFSSTVLDTMSLEMKK
jgi:predicted nucleic acid-binding protein